MPLINIQLKTPYNCTCIRELWLMLQVFIDNLSERMKTKVLRYKSLTDTSFYIPGKYLHIYRHFGTM